MRKLIFTVILTLLLSSCVSTPTDTGGTSITDAFGNTASLTSESRVVSCFASFSECWLNSGGSLVGVTDDAITERDLDFGQDSAIIGSVKNIDLEKLVSLDPDYVILSADLAAHLELQASLEQIGINYGYFKVDTFEDYRLLMQKFCDINGGDERYEEYVSRPAREIKKILENIPDTNDKSVLLIRAYSTKMKAKGSDSIAGKILDELGTINIAEVVPSVLEDLSIERIIADDPDYIFITTMGSEKSALEYIKNNLEADPAWSGLSAVRNGNYHLLPKELFHYKPNHRWNESYEYIAKIIYPEIFT